MCQKLEVGMLIDLFIYYNLCVQCKTQFSKILFFNADNNAKTELYVEVTLVDIMSYMNTHYIK